MIPRLALSAVFAIHGLIHLLGFASFWRLAGIEGLPYKTSLLYGTLDIGVAGAWVFGLLWLLVAVGFLAAGLAVSTLRPWWRFLALWVVVFSLTLTVLGWPDSYFGVLVNLGILVYLFVGDRTGWVPSQGRPSHR